MKKIIMIITFLFLLYSCWDKKIESINNIENTGSEKITENIGDENNLEELKILALWDSLTAWYSLDIQDSYPYKLQEIFKTNWYNYEIINAWVSWDTSKNLLSRLSLYEDDYKIVLLNIWWNDWLRSLSLEELESNIIKIIEKFEESKIVLFSIDLPFNYWPKYRKELKWVYENINKEKNIYFYWLFFEWLDYNEHFLPDWLHPNKSGYKIISENIYNYLLENDLINN